MYTLLVCVDVDVGVLVVHIRCLSIECFHPLAKIKPLKYRTGMSQHGLKMPLLRFASQLCG